MINPLGVSGCYFFATDYTDLHGGVYDDLSVFICAIPARQQAGVAKKMSFLW
jgi:hypothetical protein